jgi:hypothetical protein
MRKNPFRQIVQLHRVNTTWHGEDNRAMVARTVKLF